MENKRLARSASRVITPPTTSGKNPKPFSIATTALEKYEPKVQKNEGSKLFGSASRKDLRLRKEQPSDYPVDLEYNPRLAKLVEDARCCVEDSESSLRASLEAVEFLENKGIYTRPGEWIWWKSSKKKMCPKVILKDVDPERNKDLLNHYRAGEMTYTRLTRCLKGYTLIQFERGILNIDIPLFGDDGLILAEARENGWRWLQFNELPPPHLMLAIIATSFRGLAISFFFEESYWWFLVWYDTTSVVYMVFVFAEYAVHHYKNREPYEFALARVNAHLMLILASNFYGPAYHTLGHLVINYLSYNLVDHPDVRWDVQAAPRRLYAILEEVVIQPWMEDSIFFMLGFYTRPLYGLFEYSFRPGRNHKLGVVVHIILALMQYAECSPIFIGCLHSLSNAFLLYRAWNGLNWLGELALSAIAFLFSDIVIAFMWLNGYLMRGYHKVLGVFLPIYVALSLVVTGDFTVETESGNVYSLVDTGLATVNVIRRKSRAAHLFIGDNAEWIKSYLDAPTRELFIEMVVDMCNHHSLDRVGVYLLIGKWSTKKAVYSRLLAMRSSLDKAFGNLSDIFGAFSAITTASNPIENLFEYFLKVCSGLWKTAWGDKLSALLFTIFATSFDDKYHLMDKIKGKLPVAALGKFEEMLSALIGCIKDAVFNFDINMLWQESTTSLVDRFYKLYNLDNTTLEQRQDLVQLVDKLRNRKLPPKIMEHVNIAHNKCVRMQALEGSKDPAILVWIYGAPQIGKTAIIEEIAKSVLEGLGEQFHQSEMVNFMFASPSYPMPVGFPLSTKVIVMNDLPANFADGEQTRDFSISDHIRMFADTDNTGMAGAAIEDKGKPVPNLKLVICTGNNANVMLDGTDMAEKIAARIKFVFEVTGTKEIGTVKKSVNLRFHKRKPVPDGNRLSFKEEGPALSLGARHFLLHLRQVTAEIKKARDETKEDAGVVCKCGVQMRYHLQNPERPELAVDPRVCDIELGRRFAESKGVRFVELDNTTGEATALFAPNVVTLMPWLALLAIIPCVYYLGYLGLAAWVVFDPDRVRFMQMVLRVCRAVGVRDGIWWAYVNFKNDLSYMRQAQRAMAVAVAMGAALAAYRVTREIRGTATAQIGVPIGNQVDELGQLCTTIRPQGVDNPYGSKPDWANVAVKKHLVAGLVHRNVNPGDLYGLIAKQSLRVNVRCSGCNKDSNIVLVCLSADASVIPSHAVSCKCKEALVLVPQTSVGSSNGVCKFVPRAMVYKIPDKDVLVMCMPSFVAGVRSLVPFFSSGQMFGDSLHVKRVKPFQRDDVPLGPAGSHVIREVSLRIGDSSDYVLVKQARIMEQEVSVGDSGSVLIMETHESSIVGFLSGKYRDVSVFSQVSISELKEALEKVGAVNPTIDLPYMELEPLVTSDSEFPRHIGVKNPILGLYPIGTLGKTAERPVSKLVRTRLTGPVADQLAEKLSPALKEKFDEARKYRPYDRVQGKCVDGVYRHAFVEAFAKVPQTQKLDADAALYAVPKVCEYLLKDNTDTLVPASLEVAFRGDAGKFPYQNAMQYGTSCGDRYRKCFYRNKRDLFEHGDPTLDPLDLKKDVRNELLKASNDALQLRIPAPVIFGSFKDELRPSEKLDKMKVRLFYVADFTYNHLFRRFVNPILSWLLSRWYKNGFASGMNCGSADWKRLWERLRSFEKVFDLDFSSFDNCHQMFLFIAMVMYRLAKVLYKHELLAKVVYSLVLSLEYQIFVVGNDVFLKIIGMPSGVVITLIMNCIFNLLVMIASFFRLCPELEFADNVVPNVVGDDNLSAISLKASSRFNAVTVAAFALENLGYVITNATSKDGEIQAFVNWDDGRPVFLKRGFKVDGERVLAPIDPVSMFKALFYRERGADEFSRFNDAANGCLREAFLHGRDMYDEVKEFMELVSKTCYNVSVSWNESSSYEAMADKYDAGLFIVYG